MMIKNKRIIHKVLLLRPVSGLVHGFGHPRDIRIPFPLKYIEALLRKKRELVPYFIDCMANYMDFDMLLKTILKFSPDVILVYPTTQEYSMTLELSRKIKKSIDLIIVAAGQDATACPERYVIGDSPIDLVLRGECELSFMELLKRLENAQDLSGVEGIYSRDFIQTDPAIVKDPDCLPFPEYKTSDLKAYTYYYPLPFGRPVIWGHVLSSRGCPYDCIFCSQTIRESYGKEVRCRNPVAVVDEIEYLQKNGANVIAFADDNFTTSRSHVLGLCEEIKKRGISIAWSAHARVDNCDEDLLSAMKDSGCIFLRFGIESGSERIIKLLRKTGIENWAQKAESVFKAARRAHISTAALFLIGNPSENREEVLESLSLAKTLDPDLVQVCFFTPYPGSPAYEQLKDSIDLSDILNMYHYQPPFLNFSQIPNNEMRQLYKLFYRDFLLRGSYVLRHLRTYANFYLNNRQVFFTLFNMRKLIFN